MNRPDTSDFVVHFTKDTIQSAYDNLISILTEKEIHANNLPWTNRPAVCFTECPWSSILAHATRYSPYGIGFAKPFLFSQNGAPVFYVRADQFEKQKWDHDLYSFVTPYWPSYAAKNDVKYKKFKRCDYSHEREWRVPHNVNFQFKNISFIILNKYEDMAKFPKEIKDLIGRDKFILMDNYKLIEKLWPTHIM